MKYKLDGIEYNVIINRKNNKNLYIRVKEDMNIYVYCNYFTTKSMINNVLKTNELSLRKMINNVKNKNEKNNKFFYLGKQYNIIFDKNINKTRIIENNIITKNENTLNKWYKEEIIRIFDERYIYVFNNFKENIKSPILKIRNMKTRWGVYNRLNHSITLNSKLIEYNIDKIDYVILHELCHIIYFNHSKNFWNLVGKYCNNYKEIRKEMKE